MSNDTRLPSWLIRGLSIAFILGALGWAGTVNTTVVRHDTKIVNLEKQYDRIESKLDLVLERLPEKDEPASPRRHR